jgi:hypothetical protein
MSFLKKLPNQLLSKLGVASPEICNDVAKIAQVMDAERGKK